MIKVLEVNQWMSTGDLKAFKWDELVDAYGNVNLDCVSGGDSEAIQQICGSGASVKEVNETDTPPWASVWFIKDKKTGRMEYYKANYDSSD